MQDSIESLGRFQRRRVMCRTDRANDGRNLVPGKIGKSSFERFMAKRLAILIAVENYSDARIPPVQYAEADANGFAASLELAGPLDKVVLLSASATKTRINSKVRQHVRALALACSPISRQS